MTSEKEKTNKKWTSTDKYRENYDEIFSKDKNDEEDKQKNEVSEV